MPRSDEYRAKAKEFAVKARGEQGPRLRQQYQALAQSYLRLAEQAERNRQSDVVYETPPSRPGRQQQVQQARPQVQEGQQQQQIQPDQGEPKDEA